MKRACSIASHACAGPNPPRSGGRLAWLLLVAGCATVAEPPVVTPASSAPTLTAEEEAAVELVDACARYGAAMRSLFAASANALAGEVQPGPTPRGSTLAETRKDVLELPAAERPCALCRGFASCGEGGPPTSEATARLLVESAIALEGLEPVEPLPAEGGETVAAMQARWCDRCEEIGRGPAPPL